MPRFEQLANLTWHKAWRAGAALVALLMLASHVPPGPDWRVGHGRMATLSAAPVPLYTDGRPDDRVGRLRFLGGWELTASDFGFGGVSSVHVEGDIVTALSDVGVLLRFRLPRGLNDSGPLMIWPLQTVPGDPDRKADRDSESLIVADGSAWVGYEVHNQVWRYDTATWRPQAHAEPEAMRDWSSGRGPEAMVRLAPNRFLVFSEGAPDEDHTAPALLFLGDPAVGGTPVVPLRYRAPRGFRPTDATLLPDGRLLILNRNFSFLEGFTATLAIARLPEIRAGAEIVAEEIARFESPVTTDNLEALSVTQENGRTIVWIMSDDNFLALQRTLLLKFELEG